MMQEIRIKTRNAGRKTICLIRALLLTGLLFSCTDERFAPNGVTGEETECVFTVSLPAQVKTYALDADTDENDIKRMNVLAFEYKSGKYLLADWSSATGTIEGSNEAKSFTIKFGRLTQGNSYKFVLLANVENEVNELFLDGLTTGAEKEFVLSRLTLTNVPRWLIGPGMEEYRRIPMWGETFEDEIVNENTTISDLKLLRMLARINVTIDASGTPPATSLFKLKTVHLYNACTSGHIVPAADNLEAGSVLKVKAPTLVSGGSRTTSPAAYHRLINGCDISETALINNIYTFESGLPYSAGELETDKMTALVIGGKYGEDIDTTYYRINLADQGAYINILRNHSYTVNVVSVSGRGYATPDEAFNAKTTNMEAEVITWDDGSVSNIQFDGQYMLSVSQSDFSFTREKRDDASLDNLLTVTTNHPGGWAIKITDNITPGEGSDDATWLETNPTVWPGTTSSDIRLLMNANKTTAPRVAYIHITAGRLTYVVKVTQSNESGLSLNITSGGLPVTELVFTSVTGVKPTPQSFTVDWGPKKATLEVDAVGTTFPGESRDDVSDGTGTKTYTISPPVITSGETGFPFVTKTSTITYKVSGDVDEFDFLEKTLTLKQINYALVASGIEEKYYMDGSTHSFIVKANDAWTAAITNNTSGVASLNVTSGNGNASTGETVSFTIADDVYGSTAGMYGPGTFDITFTSVNGTFAPVTYTINCSSILWAGSNIYWDTTNSKLTFDNAGVTTHENYQGVFFKFGSLWGISPAGAFSASTPIYMSNGTGGHTVGYVSSWEDDIPYMITGSGTNRYNNWASQEANQTADLGDICKYLSPLHGKNWRLPVSQEFGESSTNHSYSVVNQSKFSVNNMANAAYPYGTYENANRPGYNKKSNKQNVFFPAAGYRGNSAGSSGFIGNNGYYWSSSLNGDNGYLLLISSSSLNPINSNFYRTFGFSIRCVTEQ